MNPLISAAELARILPEVTVLDVRYRMGGPPGREQYDAGHVTGASYVDLARDLADPPGDPVDDRGRHPLPDPTRFGTAMRSAGVRSDRPVVAYDDWGGRAAARAWWLLRSAGHDDVRVLDGGWARWRAAGLPVEGHSDGTKSPIAGDFRPAKGLWPVRLAPEVGLVSVDARAPERFRGETEPVDPVAGHIPGAVNIPTEANLRSDGTFRSADELAELYADVPDGTVVYCGSGVTACHDLLAMVVAGREGALYPGS